MTIRNKNTTRNLLYSFWIAENAIFLCSPNIGIEFYCFSIVLVSELKLCYLSIQHNEHRILIMIRLPQIKLVNIQYISNEYFKLLWQLFGQPSFVCDSDHRPNERVTGNEPLSMLKT